MTTHKARRFINSIEFGSEIYYFIEDKHIKSVVSAQIAHGAYIGYIIINYKYENSQFVLDDIGYSEKFRMTQGGLGYFLSKVESTICYLL